MKPSGLSSFYQKYTEAYGIPVLGSSRVTDDALRRACYTLRFALADRADVRQSFYSLSGRVAIIARSERTTQIPEHSGLDSAYWDKRARGLGATTATPISTGAEENVLCDANDPYHTEDIFLHELSHGLDNLGASQVMSGWTGRVDAAYNAATSSGRWTNTYAGSNPTEYFAEGVVTYFNDQDERNPGDGIHNYVNTRSELQAYDAGLYDVIRELFPCGNQYLRRCHTSRGQEQAQNLRMDCAGQTQTGGSSGGGSGCTDDNENCQYWATHGECSKANSAYMLQYCRLSCAACGGGGSAAACTDSNENCVYWATHGECSNNPAYMLLNCKHSCGACGSLVGR